MLSWWRSRPPGDASHQEDDEDDNIPETPAPVFAARALKSAIFGTPQLFDYESAERARPIDISPSRKPRTEVGLNMSPSKMSPMKTGILLTPGTGPSRRKSVTFGEDVGGQTTTASKSGLPDDFPGKFPSPWVKNPDSRPTRKTELTRTLENARSKKTVHERAPTSRAQGKDDKKHAAKSKSTSAVETDMTEDLNCPHSESGKYWKTEYEKYQKDAQEEMRKLIRYKQLAKTYAKQKDDEAYELGEKLLEEQQKVNLLERKLERVSKEVPGGAVDVAQTRELARFKTLAERYKRQLDELQGLNSEKMHAFKVDEMEDHDHQSDSRTEIRNLRLNLSTAERRVARLQNEKSKINEELANLKKDLIRSERHRSDAEAQCQKREATIQSLQDDYSKLRELARSQRRDAENALKMRHEQVVTLRKEVANLRRQARESDLLTHKSKIETELLADSTEDLITLDSPRKWEKEIGALETRIDDSLREAASARNGMKKSSRAFDEIKIREDTEDSNDARVLDIPTPRRALPAAAVPSPFKTNNKLRQTPGPLSERSQDRNEVHVEETLGKRLSGTGARAARWQSHNDAEGSEVPSVAATPVARSKRTMPSPRPSMVLLTSIPARPAISRGRSSLSRTPKRFSNFASARSRVSLPPERAAAALARLQQRNAEKKQRAAAVLESMDYNKENIQR